MLVVRHGTASSMPVSAVGVQQAGKGQTLGCTPTESNPLCPKLAKLTEAFILTLHQRGHCKPPFVTALSGTVLTAPPYNQPSSQSSKNQVVSTKFQQRGQGDCRVFCPFLCQLLLPFPELSSSLARNFRSQFHDFMDRSI